MLSPWPGPRATATRPEVAMRRSASSAPRPATAPGRTSISNGAGSIRASRGMSARLVHFCGHVITFGNHPRRPGGGRSVARGDDAGAAQVIMVVDLHPRDVPDGGD